MTRIKWMAHGIIAIADQIHWLAEGILVMAVVCGLWAIGALDDDE